MTGKVEVKAEEQDYEDELTAALDKTKSGDAQDLETDAGEEDKAAETPEEEKAAEGESEQVTISQAEYERLNRQAADSRSLILSQKRQLSSLEAQVKRLERNQTKLASVPQAEKDDEDDEGQETKTGKSIELEGPGEEEQIQSNIKKISDERGGIFDLMLEQMSSMESYKDVAQVCSEAHTQDIVHAVANQLAKDDGIEFGLAALKVEHHIWSQPNPYRYLYKLIKDYHPDYAKGDVKEKDVKEKARTQEPVKAPGSIAGFTGSKDTEGTGWTAKRIEELPEDELSKVPADIYERYMAGHLD